MWHTSKNSYFPFFPVGCIWVLCFEKYADSRLLSSSSLSLLQAIDMSVTLYIKYTCVYVCVYTGRAMDCTIVTVAHIS